MDVSPMQGSSRFHIYEYFEVMTPWIGFPLIDALRARERAVAKRTATIGSDGSSMAARNGLE